jgi:glycosyltransferase involved in cell wall biosynthesis
VPACKWEDCLRWRDSEGPALDLFSLTKALLGVKLRSSDSMPDRPYISIVTPVLNMEQTIERTLRSLKCQRADFEHIVLDGGSTDRTQEIVKSYSTHYPVRLHVDPGGGVYGGVIKGFRHSSGEIMAWINGDDFYLPWTLAVVQHIFRTRPQIEWICGISSIYFEESGLCTTARFARYYVKAFMKRGWYRGDLFGFLPQESMFWRRGLWEKAKGGEVLTKYRYAADYHLWRTFGHYAQLHSVGSMLACFTVRMNQLSDFRETEYFKECGCRRVRYTPHALCNLLSFLLTGIFEKRILRVAGVGEVRATAGSLGAIS